MKIFDTLRMANANLFRNKIRSILTIIAIFVGSFTIILNSGINYGVNQYVNKQLDNVGGNGYLEVLKTSENLTDISIGIGSSGPTEFDPNATPMIEMITESDLKTLRNIDGVERATGLPMVSAKYIESLENGKRFDISLNTFPSSRLHIDMLTGRTVDNDSDMPEIIILPDYAEALGFTDESIIGQTVELGVALHQLPSDTGPETIKNLEVKVVGVQNRSVVSMGRSFINFAAADAIQELALSNIPEQFRAPNSFMFAVVEIPEDASDEEVERIRTAMRDAGFQAMTIAEQVGMVMSIFDAISMVLNIFGAIALLAASIGIINTLFMAVQERTREIGLMKAMGLSNGKIFLMFSAEAIMLGFWGSVVGIAVALVARAVGNNIANNTFLSNLPGFTLIEFNPPQIAGIVVLIMFIAFLAGALPARRAARQNPIDALRYE
ncbi:ABC transporter permease [Candidatus Saccharibacteria bacterium]|nr:ABC transporter permease [Candidatus Saccharibacteria bacterium]